MLTPRDDRSWLSRLAPGVVKNAVKRRATKDLWIRCDETGELCYRPDLEAALRKAGELGGSTVVPPTEIPNMVTFAIFTDPQGHRIGLIRR